MSGQPEPAVVEPAVPSPPPGSPKASSILQTLNPFHRRSRRKQGEASPPATEDTEPAVLPRPPRQVPFVDLAPRAPRAPPSQPGPPSHFSSSSSSLPFGPDDSASGPPLTPRSSIAPGAPSLRSYGTSFTSLVPESENYSYELARLQLQYRVSQESLRMEREFSSQQQALFDRERAATEARHQAELEAVRRQVSEGSGKGKGKSRKL